MLPAGFMAQAHDGRLEVVFCSASGALGAHDRNDSSNQFQSGSHVNFCLFSHAGAAPLPAFDITPAVVTIIAGVAAAHVSPPSTLGPARFKQARGPPALS